MQKNAFLLNIPLITISMHTHFRQLIKQKLYTDGFEIRIWRIFSFFTIGHLSFKKHNLQYLQNVAPQTIFFTLYHYHVPKYKKPEREGTLGFLLPKSPLFLNNVLLFVGLTTLGTFIEFFWLAH